MKTSCIVVDDERLAREGVEEFIQRTPFLQHLASFGQPFEALDFMRREKVDLLFLDIQMPDMTGLELMKVLTHPPKVIFTTAHREFALDGFELDATDYLLKPISYERFLRAAQKVLPATSTNLAAAYIFVKCDGIMVRISFADILFLESAKDYVLIYTIQQRYMTMVPMRQMEAELPLSHFMRVHRSYLIAVEQVSKVEGNLLHIREHRVPISRRMREEVLARIIGNKLIEKE